MRTTSHWAVLFVLLLFSVRAQARTWRVFADGTGDTPNIQAALDAAIPGDSIAVAPGTYFENLSIRKPAITLHSTHGPEVTRLDGNHADRVIMVFERNASIQGFTIAGGRTRFEGTFFAPGGGVSILGDATVLRNNIIEQNESGVLFDHHSGGEGGGVFVDALYCVVEGNTIRGNVAGSTGGGISASGLHEQTNTIVNNMIIGNASGLAGGAVAGTSARFTGNVVAENFHRVSPLHNCTFARANRPSMPGVTVGCVSSSTEPWRVRVKCEIAYDGQCPNFSSVSVASSALQEKLITWCPYCPPPCNPPCELSE